MQKLLLPLLAGAMSLVPLVRADMSRTQTFNLKKGWNAVYLEVGPAESSPSAVFGETPIDVAACYLEPGSPAQFMTNPGADLFRQTGWGVWYSEDRPDAFLKTLHSILGQKAYLLHATADFTWQVTGSVEAAPANWQAGAYNLAGFAVDAAAPPTFAQFFAGSDKHDLGRLYRLVNGAWKKVTAPDSATMRPGEAFWIYCGGASDYCGPLKVETDSGMGLMLSSAGADLVLRNRMPHPVAPTLHYIAGEDGPPVSIIIQTVSDPAEPVKQVAAAMPAGDWTQNLPAIEAGASLRVPLAARTEDMAPGMHTALLKISTDLGTEVWLPVIGVREDTEEK